MATKKVEIKKVDVKKAPAKKAVKVVKVEAKKTAKVSVKKVAEKKPTKKAAPKKAASANEYPYVELVHPLLTQNYTKILHEDPFKFNAPNLFKVIKAEPEATGKHKGQHEVVGLVHFQEGPIKECGVNGVANEDLLGMVLCRLESFQKSEYKCRENACAITKIEEALMWLRKRTNARVKRGVVETSKV
jgi:hypothetical protein